MAVAANEVVGRLEGVLRGREVRKLESRDEWEESEEDRAHDEDEHRGSDRLGGDSRMQAGRRDGGKRS
jgi:hypothetical protein